MTMPRIPFGDITPVEQHSNRQNSNEQAYEPEHKQHSSKFQQERRNVAQPRRRKLQHKKVPAIGVRGIETALLGTTKAAVNLNGIESALEDADSDSPRTNPLPGDITTPIRKRAPVIAMHRPEVSRCDSCADELFSLYGESGSLSPADSESEQQANHTEKATANDQSHDSTTQRTSITPAKRWTLMPLPLPDSEGEDTEDELGTNCSSPPPTPTGKHSGVISPAGPTTSAAASGRYCYPSYYHYHVTLDKSRGLGLVLLDNDSGTVGMNETNTDDLGNDCGNSIRSSCSNNSSSCQTLVAAFAPIAAVSKDGSSRSEDDEVEEIETCAGPAELSGRICVGDILVSVASTDVTSIPHDDLLSMLGSLPSGAVTLTFARAENHEHDTYCAQGHENREKKEEKMTPDQQPQVGGGEARGLDDRRSSSEGIKTTDGESSESGERAVTDRASRTPPGSPSKLNLCANRGGDSSSGSISGSMSSSSSSSTAHCSSPSTVLPFPHAKPVLFPPRMYTSHFTTSVVAEAETRRMRALLLASSSPSSASSYGAHSRDGNYDYDHQCLKIDSEVEVTVVYLDSEPERWPELTACAEHGVSAGDMYQSVHRGNGISSHHDNSISASTGTQSTTTTSGNDSTTCSTGSTGSSTTGGNGGRSWVLYDGTRWVPKPQLPRLCMWLPDGFLLPSSTNRSVLVSPSDLAPIDGESSSSRSIADGSFTATTTPATSASTTSATKFSFGFAAVQAMEDSGILPTVLALARATASGTLAVSSSTAVRAAAAAATEAKDLAAKALSVSLAAQHAAHEQEMSREKERQREMAAAVAAAVADQERKRERAVKEAVAGALSEARTVQAEAVAAAVAAAVTERELTHRAEVAAAVAATVIAAQSSGGGGSSAIGSGSNSSVGGAQSGGASSQSWFEYFGITTSRSNEKFEPPPTAFGKTKAGGHDSAVVRTVVEQALAKTSTGARRTRQQNQAAAAAAASALPSVARDLAPASSFVVGL